MYIIKVKECHLDIFMLFLRPQLPCSRNGLGLLASGLRKWLVPDLRGRVGSGAGLPSNPVSLKELGRPTSDFETCSYAAR